MIAIERGRYINDSVVIEARLRIVPEENSADFRVDVLKPAIVNSALCRCDKAVYENQSSA